jgi:hypothetical protein
LMVIRTGSPLAIARIAVPNSNEEIKSFAFILLV